MTHIDKDALLGWLRDFKASEHSAKHCDLMDTGALDGEEALEAVIEYVEQMETEKGEKKMEVHVYKGFNLVKNGFPKTPWNIYKINGHGYGEWLWYGTTLEGCKADIERGCFPPSSCDGKPCCMCDEDEPMLDMYTEREGQ